MFLQDLLLNLKTALFDIGNAFVVDPSIWWLIAPIILLWLATEFYTGEYKNEAFSFSGMLAGGISLFWINIISIRTFFLLDRNPLKEQSFYALGFFAIYAIVLIYIALTHKISSYNARWIGRTSVLYFLSILSILWGQGTLMFNEFILIDLFVLLIIFDAILVFIKYNFLGLWGDIERVKEARGKKTQN